MTVGVGTLLAQTIALIASPVLTRVFNSDEFGFFGTYISFQGIFFVLFAAKYEGAIIITRTSAGAVNALVLTLLIAGTCMVGGTVILTVFAGGVLWLQGSAPFNLIFCLLPVSTFVAIVYLAQAEWAIRKARFSDLPVYRLVSATSTAGSSVALGMIGVSGGLVYGVIFGQLVAVMVAVRAFFIRERELLQTVSWRRLRHTAVKYVSFPKYVVPAQLINAISGSVPILFITYRFGLAEVGFLALVDRICSGPLSIIGNSIRDVLKNEAVTRIREQGDCRDLYRKVTFVLIAVCVPPLGVLISSGPQIFGFVFGAEWIEAGRYASVLAVSYAAAFLCMPTACLFAITENQRLELAWQGIFLGLMIVSVLVGLLIKSAYGYVVILAVMRSLAYFALLAFNYFLAGPRACRLLRSRRILGVPA